MPQPKVYREETEEIRTGPNLDNSSFYHSTAQVPSFFVVCGLKERFWFVPETFGFLGWSLHFKTINSMLTHICLIKPLIKVMLSPAVQHWMVTNFSPWGKTPFAFASFRLSCSVLLVLTKSKQGCGGIMLNKVVLMPSIHPPAEYNPYEGVWFQTWCCL